MPLATAEDAPTPATIEQAQEEASTIQDIMGVIGDVLGEDTRKTLEPIVKTVVDVATWIKENPTIVNSVVNTLSAFCKACKAAFKEFKVTKKIVKSTKESLSKAASEFGLEFKAAQIVGGLDADELQETAGVSTAVKENMIPVEKRTAELAATKIYTSLDARGKAALNTELATADKPFLKAAKEAFQAQQQGRATGHADRLAAERAAAPEAGLART